MAGAQKFLIAALLRNAAAGHQWGAAAQHANGAAAAASTALLIRNSSFQSSPKVRPLAEYPEVEVVRNAPEWQFVERLLPPAIIPKPKLPPAACHSGWRPQLAATATGTAAGGSADALRYFVARTKNHMIPVYLQTTHRGERRITVVRRVQGDIWALERELRALVEKARNGRLCASRVNEMSGQVRFHGDHVDLLRDYLKEKGF